MREVPPALRGDWGGRLLPRGGLARLGKNQPLGQPCSHLWKKFPTGAET